jgi:hypothetical protein
MTVQSKKDDAFSVKKISYEAKKELSSVIASTINLRKKTLQENKTLRFKRELNKINKKLSLDEQSVSKIIDELNTNHEKLTSEMVEQGISVGVVEKLSPKLRLVVSRNLLIKPEALTVEDLNTTSFSAEDWRYLKLLSNSNDLKVLLSNNELSFEFVQIANLKRLYGK